MLPRRAVAARRGREEEEEEGIYSTIFMFLEFFVWNKTHMHQGS